MDISSTRRSNLMLMLQQELDGTDVVPRDVITQEFAQRIGLTVERFTSVQSDMEDFSDELARDIEKRSSMPNGWLDQDNRAYPSDQDAAHRQERLDNLYREAPPEVRDALIEKEEADQQDNQKDAGDAPNVVQSN